MSGTPELLAGLALAGCAVLATLLVVARRVLYRQAREIDLLESRETRWRELADSVPAGIFEMDAAGNRIYSNRRLLAITGQEMADSMFNEAMVHPDDLEALRDIWQRASKTGSVLRERFRIRRANDGQQRWLAVEIRPRHADGQLLGWAGSVLDVTDDVEEAASLRRATEILEATPDLVAMVDTQGRFTYANAAARRTFGARIDDDLATRRAVDIYAPHERSRFFGEAVPTAARDGVWSGEIDLALPEGGQMRVSQVLVAHRRTDGSVEYYSSITRDLSERRAFEEQLDAVARFDALTGLPQRATFVDLLAQSLDRSRRTGERLAVMVVDLDNFKLINDSMGHDAGDAVLAETARRMVAACGPHDTVGRLGSDEFALLVHCPEESAEEAGQAIAAALGEPVVVAGHGEIFVTASIGIARGGDDPLVTPETLLRDADAATQRAKERGRARVELFVEDYRQTAMHRLRTANDLHRAITGGDLRVAYQPEVDLRTGHIIGVEALVRWLHPQRGVIPPSEFIPLAEQSGLISDVGLHVLETAVTQAAGWSTARHDGGPLGVWVNLSARQLVDDKLVDLVSDMLDRHKVAPAQLGLEITESALLDDASAAVAALHALRALGVRLAIDDFGTGFSSLSYLKQLPIDAVKIDRSFVDGVGSDGDDSAIVAAVTGMARALRLSTIAEGVENVQQLAALQTLGCNAGQGYLFATPQTARRISRLLVLDRQSPVGRFPASTVPDTPRSLAAVSVRPAGPTVVEAVPRQR